MNKRTHLSGNPPIVGRPDAQPGLTRRDNFIEHTAIPVGVLVVGGLLFFGGNEIYNAVEAQYHPTCAVLSEPGDTFDGLKKTYGAEHVMSIYQPVGIDGATAVPTTLQNNDPTNLQVGVIVTLGGVNSAVCSSLNGDPGK